MATLDDAIVNITAVLRNIPGIRTAPDYPPDKISLYPFVVVWVGPGTWQFGAGGLLKKGLHTIRVELHQDRTDLARAIKAIMPYADSVPNELMRDVTFGGTVSTFELVRSDGIVPMNWNGIDTIGIRWYIENVKIETAIE